MQYPLSAVPGYFEDYKYFLPKTNQVDFATRKEKSVLFDKCKKLNMQDARTVVKIIKVSTEKLIN